MCKRSEAAIAELAQQRQAALMLPTDRIGNRIAPKMVVTLDGERWKVQMVGENRLELRIIGGSFEDRRRVALPGMVEVEL